MIFILVGIAILFLILGSSTFPLGYSVFIPILLFCSVLVILVTAVIVSCLDRKREASGAETTTLATLEVTATEAIEPPLLSSQIKEAIKEERTKAEQACFAIDQEMDKILVSAPLGGMAASLAVFWGVTNTKSIPVGIEILTTCWILLAIAFATAFLSSIFASIALQIKMEVLDACYRQTPLPKERIEYKKWAMWLERISVTIFTFGAISLFIFCHDNIENVIKTKQLEKASNDQPKTDSTTTHAHAKTGSMSTTSPAKTGSASRKKRQNFRSGHSTLDSQTGK